MTESSMRASDAAVCQITLNVHIMTTTVWRHV